MTDQTISGMLRRRAEASPTGAAIRYKKDGNWTDVSWSDLTTRMDNIAAGLLTAMDIPDHAAISILGNTTADWIACDFAALSVGLRTVPVYASLLPEEVGYLHTDTEAVLAIVEDKKGLEKVREMRKGFTFFDREYSADEVKIEHIVVMFPEGIEPADDWESLADLEARGQEKLEETAEDRQRRFDQPGRDDTATYTYTSGTTGPPKGVIQTHGNMLAMLESSEQTKIFESNNIRAGGFFLFLPLAHSFGRLIELAAPFFDAPIVISSVPTLGADLGETRPGFFPAAPRVFEKMMAKIESKVAGASGFKKGMFEWAFATGKETIPYRSEGKPIPGWLNFKFGLADKAVFSKLRPALGFDRAEVLLSGSAPLSVPVHEFFLAMGLNLLEAYGLTETCPGLTTNMPTDFRLGTVGKPFPGVSIEIADDGEILAKGPNITAGYLNREDATSEAFNSDGWFCTGDLGAMDEDGFIKITGRKKELMKTSGGKYIAPAKLEGRLKTLPMIQEVITIADTRNYVTALVSIDPEELGEWATQTGNPAEADSDPVKAAVQAHIDEVNGTLASFETVKYFRIIPMLTVDDGLLTASLKVKRGPVYDRYESQINDMYASGKK